VPLIRKFKNKTALSLHFFTFSAVFASRGGKSDQKMQPLDTYVWWVAYKPDDLFYLGNPHLSAPHYVMCQAVAPFGHFGRLHRPKEC